MSNHGLRSSSKPGRATERQDISKKGIQRERAIDRQGAGRKCHGKTWGETSKGRKGHVGKGALIGWAQGESAMERPREKRAKIGRGMWEKGH